MAQPSSKRRKTETPDGATITDSRFANIQSDPRYRLPGKKQKIKLDKRFARELRDEDFTRKAKVDRYGRPLESTSEKERLKRKYEFEESDPDEESDAADDDEEVQRELKRVEETRDVLREGKDASSSSESDGSSDEESDLEVDEEEGPTPGVPQGNVVMGEVSARLAIVNLDWDNIRAEDLMAVFSSFLPSTGRLFKVSIYPSDFGKERMEREELEGPPREIFASSSKRAVEDESSNETESEQDEDDIKASMLKPDDGSEFDSTALRQYQLDRLRYFYAILTFSSAEAAKHIYDAVDGTEYLSTANFFDLRFVPDETDFSDDKPREECTEIPSGYKPNEFVTDALQHSKVKLTWDAEDVGRKEAQARAFSGGRREIDENDLKAYLASDSESEDDATNLGDDVPKGQDKQLSKKELERQRMRALLGLAPEPVKDSKRDKNGPTGNIQITFSSGLGGPADASDSDEPGAKRKKKHSVFANSPEPEETTVEKYVRKEKERKQRRKGKMKTNRVDDGQDVDTEEERAVEKESDLGFDDPFFAEPTNDKVAANKSRKEERLKRREERAAEEAASAKQRAELELLMADDDDQETPGATGKQGRTVKHFDMGEIEKAEKLMSKQGKKGKKLKSKGKAAQVVLADDDFQIDPSESRFASLYENHEFAIDPTNSRYKKTKAMKSLLDEGRRRKVENLPDEVRQTSSEPRKKSGQVKPQQKHSDEGIMGLVEKIKRRNK